MGYEPWTPWLDGECSNHWAKVSSHTSSRLSLNSILLCLSLHALMQIGILPEPVVCTIKRKKIIIPHFENLPDNKKKYCKFHSHNWMYMRFGLKMTHSIFFNSMCYTQFPHIFESIISNYKNRIYYTTIQYIFIREPILDVLVIQVDMEFDWDQI